jgi:hypothetical protein
VDDALVPAGTREKQKKAPAIADAFEVELAGRYYNRLNAIRALVAEVRLATESVESVPGTEIRSFRSRRRRA